MISAEIDTELPNLSNFDIDKYHADTEIAYNSYSVVEKGYFKRQNRQYPWTRRSLYQNGKQLLDVSQFIELLPIFDIAKFWIINPTIISIYQPEQGNYDFKFHFDGDRPFGYRLCYGLDISKVFVEFSKLKEEFREYSYNGKKIEDRMVEEQLYRLVPKRSNTIFKMDGVIYPHRVPLNASTGRLVFIVTGIPKNIEHAYLQTIYESDGD